MSVELGVSQEALVSFSSIGIRGCGINYFLIKGLWDIELQQGIEGTHLFASCWNIVHIHPRL